MPWEYTVYGTYVAGCPDKFGLRWPPVVSVVGVYVTENTEQMIKLTDV